MRLGVRATLELVERVLVERVAVAVVLGCLLAVVRVVAVALVERVAVAVVLGCLPAAVRCDA